MRSLRTKLIATYLIVASFSLLLVFLFVRLTMVQRMQTVLIEQEMTVLQEEVVNYYMQADSWDGFQAYFNALHAPSDLQNGPGDQTGTRQRMHGVVDAEYIALIPTLGFNAGEMISAELITLSVPVQVDGEIVAYIVPDTLFGLQNEELLYLERTNNALVGAALLGVIGALAMGVGLASVLLRPINELMRATEAMSQGDLEQRVSVRTEDELGQLASTFNQMSAELALADQQRRQLTADITHDLNAPLQVISGYVETMQDGSLPLTTERIGIIATEIEQIRRLINDLGVLVETDANALSLQMHPADPCGLLKRVARSYGPLADGQQVELKLVASHDLPYINVDEERMVQVLGNLINNALRYTPTGGSIWLSAQSAGDRLLIKIRDTGCGIAAENLPFIFDRFYRVDPSRDGNSGKMGLGLAISKALVDAQGGEIFVDSAGIDQGAIFTIAFPIDK